MDALELGTGITSVTLLCASTIAGPPAPVVTVTVTAPATPTSRAQTSEDEDFEEQLRAAEQLIVTCDSVVSDVLKLAKEQNSGALC